MIKEITIERFKNIEGITLPLSNINVLVGANNAGKSSILQSIQFAVSIAQTTSLEEFRATKWKNDKLSTSLTANQIIYSPIRDIYSLGNGGSLSQDKTRAISVKFVSDNGESANFLLRKGRNKNLLTQIEGQSLGNLIRDIENPFSIYVPGLAGIPAFEELKSEGIITRAAAKGDANNVFRNILWLLNQNQTKWVAFVKDFEDIFPNLNINISFDRLKDEHLNVYISVNNKNYPIDSFGTGVLQTIQILSYIHLYNPKILILDEPDSHLHPSNQRIIANKLNEITIRLNFQIILSTHSRHLLDAFKDYADINWISNGQISSKEYSFLSVLLEIGALDKGDILNNGQIKCIVLSEDANTEYLQVLLNANNFDLSQTDIWPYEGCSKIDTAIVLSAFIKQKAPGTIVLIHRDKDYLDADDISDIQLKAKKASIEIFFTIGTDIESHFLQKKHLHRVYSHIDMHEIERILDEATIELEKKSQQNFINAATQKALSKQYAGGERVNNGLLATKCIELYNSDKDRYRHGKLVFKQVRHKLQNLHGTKNLLIPTEDLKLLELEKIQKRIWP